MGLKFLAIMSGLYAMMFMIGVLVRFNLMDQMIIAIMFWTISFLLNRMVENKKWRVNVVIKERRGSGIERVSDKYRRVMKEFREVQKIIGERVREKEGWK